ncbi:structural maintenance of chromosomes flexible hinge domain-containing protein 1 isoform X2 [Trematomus bernacchii]|uniref:structural maintenance of chromosomes flexible hinge domain-containing protein 1 isoform X2 n=1 Tax=Trematomus bernacchii TaxID=40690 RepID=UPI00146DA57B|nr:structural maintenance of chromosomes flexible hinge domain-containing protein 1 isoform X2 [Trematomus bernacchii]
MPMSFRTSEHARELTTKRGQCVCLKLKAGTAHKMQFNRPFMEGGKVRRRIRVYDCRSKDGEKVNQEMLETSGLDFKGFIKLLHRKFEIRSNETFVLATTDRAVLNSKIFEELQDDSTLHLLKQKHQALTAATEEIINFTPHYDTLIQSGTYEYWASRGQNPLPYSLAELIDNALSATAKNQRVRKIEIRMMFDDNLGKPAVIVLDNGCGMTSKQLKNWAVYRLSKFTRDIGSYGSEEEGYVRPDPVPRSLNSDISFFGVGGKQAVFHIGDSVRMISKAYGSPDVHEMVISKQDFENKVKNKEDVYSGIIRNRKPGDFSHVEKNDERFLHNLILEESGKEKFTAVVITGVFPDHIAFLKQDIKVWTRQLAQVYHYYIHGVNGKELSDSSADSDCHSEIKITISLRDKPPVVMDLREVENDVQTLYIKSAVDTFEFKATTTQDGGTVDGLIRYHPFLYDRETYPEDPDAVQAPDDEDDGVNEPGVLHQERRKRPIFDCFWNGRLIPYTTVSEFDWCAQSKGVKELAECYSRISGVLFTDDRFPVSTNKLTFMELELTLKHRDSFFTRIVKGQKQRGNIQKEFTQWLKNCHEKWDKQVKFLNFKKTITRTELSVKRMQYPWATFTSIEWDGKTYSKGQLVKSQKTQPILYGSVVRFLLYGQHEEDVFATGGEVEICMEPKAFHDKIKTIPISKIDKNATSEAIQRNIDNDLAKLPEFLSVSWPEGDPWLEGGIRPAGTPLGPLNVNIMNKKGESMSQMPAVGQGAGKRLIIDLKVFQHGQKKEVLGYATPTSAKFFWFKKIETLTGLGEYTLILRTLINESKVDSFGGRELPSYKLNFTIKEGKAESFVIGTMSSSLRVGMPFDIPLQIKDGYDHPTAPPPDLKPILKCSGLTSLNFDKTDSSETTLYIRCVKASGKVLNYQQPKTYDLKVTLPGLAQNTETIKFSLLPGTAHSIHVTPEDKPIKVENGKTVLFNVEIHDEEGNITANAKQIVRCQVQGFPAMATDCSNSGAGQIVVKPVNLKITKGHPEKLNVQFEMPSQKKIKPVVRELEVVPSKRVCLMKICCKDDENLVLTDNEKILWLAGGLMENLFYKLYDEAGRDVPLTAEIASKIKVNWTGDVNVKDLVQGKLPDLRVPSQVQVERFFQVSYQDQNVSVSFHIIPQPDEPKRLKATLLKSTVKLGEVIPGNISLELVDQYDNATKTLSSDSKNHMAVKAEGLVESAITFKWLERSSSVLVMGVQFRSGTLGPREICFTYEKYEERVIVKVTAGVPAQLKLVSGPVQPLQVLNDQGIDTPFVVQLCDEWGNLCSDQRVVVELKSSPQSLKVKSSVVSQPVNVEGKASFTVTSLSGPKGYYQLDFKGSLDRKPIPGPSVNITITPDPNKPVSLSVVYDNNATFPAGGVFPVFSVKVVSDEGSPITTFNPAAASMLLWKGVPSGRIPPKTATELKCSKPMENQKNDRFYFRDKEIPEQVGKHTIQFSLRLERAKLLFSEQITINVVANQPVKLGPASQPPTPVVSYSKVLANRTLVENMTLRIMDSSGNPAGEDLNGNVVISIKNCSGDSNQTIPLFEGKTKRLEISLEEGKAHVNRLALMENSPGENGSAYTLLFTPKGPMVPPTLAPFELPFHFYNDADNQRKMSELSKKKDDLTTAVHADKELFNTYGQLLNVLTSHHIAASRKETSIRKELDRRNMETAQTIPHFDRLITRKRAEIDKIMKAPRRVCSLQDHYKGQQDVLGMVGHLAFVQDDHAAWVISWHIQGDMDCVITKTTEAAKRIYDDTRGRQQVMALDSVYVHPGNRPLPHMGSGCMLFDPPGNPIFARDLLQYTADRDRDIAFKNILGETILIDDLDSANNYRKAVVQKKKPCPTILTRQGDRVSSRGKFGGKNNKALPIDTLKVFGAPLSQHYFLLKDHIDLLTQQRLALEKVDQAAKDRDHHLNDMKSPVMLRKVQEMEERKKQLEEIERQLVSTPGRPLKRALDNAGEPSGINPKRSSRDPRLRSTIPT